MIVVIINLFSLLYFVFTAHTLQGSFQQHFSDLAGHPYTIKKGL